MILFLGVFAFSQGIYGQDRTIDSLKLALKNAKHDTTRCNVLNQLAELSQDETLIYTEQLLKLAQKNSSSGSKQEKSFYLRHYGDALGNMGMIANSEDNVPKAIEYFNKSLKVYEQIDDKEGMAFTLNNLGFMYQNVSDIPKALEYFMKSLKFAEAIDDKAGLSNLLNNIGLLYFYKGDHRTAMEYYEKCLKMQEEIGYKEGICISLNNIAVIYDNRGEIAKALEAYERSLKVSEEIGSKADAANTLSNVADIYNKQGDIQKALEYHHRSFRIKEELKDKRGIAESLNFIGLIYFQQGDISKTLEYYKKSLKIREEIQDKMGVSVSLNNLGQVYRKQNDLPKALDYFNRSLKLKEEIGDKLGMAYALANLGVIYDDDKKDFEKAMEYYTKSLKLREEINDKEGIAHSSANIANAMYSMGELLTALIYGERSLKLSKELGFPASINHAATILKKIYTRQNKYKEAYEMFDLEIRMRDSINSQETKKAAIKKQFEYAYEKQAARDSVRNAEEQKIKDAKLTTQRSQLTKEKTQRFALYGGLLLVIAFGGFVFNRFKVAQKQKVIIESQKQEVDEAYEKLHEKNKQVMDSINYARLIQRSLLPSEKYITRILNGAGRTRS